MDGVLVAEFAPPISSHNIGNKMLRNLGWEGGALGSNSGGGILCPVQAVVKNNKHGLGY